METDHQTRMGSCSSSPTSSVATPPNWEEQETDQQSVETTDYLRPETSTGTCLRVLAGDSFVFAGKMGDRTFRFYCSMFGYRCDRHDLDASDVLRQQIEGKQVGVHIHGHDGYGRLVVSVDVDEANVNQYMISRGVGVRISD